MALADTQRLRTAKVSAAADADAHTLANRCTFGNANPATHADSNPYYSPQDLGCHATLQRDNPLKQIRNTQERATSLL
ncbi:MAG: hypothetical protein WCA06_01910 [Terrimicrobiaceae bacterium]